MKLKYRRLTVEVDFVRPKKCCVCEKTFKKIDMHHWKYAYKTDEVRKNPQLALHYTIPVCFYCHRIADAFRKLTENADRSDKIAKEIIKYYKAL